MMGGVSAPCLYMHIKLVTIATITDPTHLIMGGAVTQCHSLSPRSRCFKCLITDLEVDVLHSVLPLLLPVHTIPPPLLAGQRQMNPQMREQRQRLAAMFATITILVLVLVVFS